MIKTRYTFFKNIYKDYVVLLSRRKSYVTYEWNTLKIVGREYIRRLKDNQVNYLIIDGLEIVFKSEYTMNRYELYKKRYLLLRILEFRNRIKGQFFQD